MVSDRVQVAEEIRLDRAVVAQADAMLLRCARRLQASPAPDGRALGAEAEDALLDLAAAVARYDKRVELHGGEGRRPAYVEPAPEPSPVLKFQAADAERTA